MPRAVNPTTGEVVSEYPEHSSAEVDRKLARAAAAFPGFSGLSFDGRASLMRKVAERFASERDGLAKLMADEMGKPIAQGRAEVDKCRDALVFYADNAARFLADEGVETAAKKAFVAFRPLGAVL